MINSVLMPSASQCSFLSVSRRVIHALNLGQFRGGAVLKFLSMYCKVIGFGEVTMGLVAVLVRKKAPLSFTYILEGVSAGRGPKKAKGFPLRVKGIST